MTGRKALFAALALLGALLTAALFLSFDASGLGREVEERLRSAAGIRLEYSRPRIGFLRGLSLEDVRASVGSYDLRVPRVVLEHRPLALLWGGFQLTGVKLDEARVGRFSIEALRLTLARLDYDSRAVTALHGIGTEGRIEMRRAAFASWEVSDLSARIAATGGRVRFEQMKLRTGRGDLSGELALDFNSLPFRYRASLLGSSFEMEGVGRGAITLETAGFGSKARDVTGSGVFTLAPGRFSDASWVGEIDPSLAGAEHGPVEIPFEIRDERVYIEGVEIDAAGRRMEIEGSFGLDGSRDLRVSKPS